MDQSRSLDPRLKSLLDQRDVRTEGRGDKEEETAKRCQSVTSLEMKALLKKWYGLPKKDRGRIISDEEEEEEEGTNTRSSIASTSSSSTLRYDIPKKRRRYLDTPVLSSALIPVYSASPPQEDEEEEEEEDELLETEEGEEEPQNLVMDSHRRKSAEDAQNNNQMTKDKKAEEEIRDGICSWCLHTLDHPRSCQFSMSILDDPTSKRNKIFCSERCFTLYRRAAFKKNKYCDLCKKPTTSNACIQYQTSFDDKLIFCSESCLKTYKVDEATRREKLSNQCILRRTPLSDNLENSSKSIPLMNKKNNKQSRRPQDKSYSQTPIVKVKPDMALKSNEGLHHRKKQLPSQPQPQRLDSVPAPSNGAAHSFHIMPPHIPSSTLRPPPPFLGILPEHTNSQPLLPLAALAGALAASSRTAIPSVPPPNPPRPHTFSPPHILRSLPSPITLCPTPFFVPLPIPIPLLIPVPEKSFKGTPSPGTSHQHINTSNAKVKRETPSPNKINPQDNSIKTEFSLEENEVKRRRKRGSFVSEPQNSYESK